MDKNKNIHLTEKIRCYINNCSQYSFVLQLLDGFGSNKPQILVFLSDFDDSTDVYTSTESNSNTGSEENFQTPPSQIVEDVVTAREGQSREQISDETVLVNKFDSMNLYEGNCYFQPGEMFIFLQLFPGPGRKDFYCLVLKGWKSLDV